MTEHEDEEPEPGPGPDEPDTPDAPDTPDTPDTPDDGDKPGPGDAPVDKTDKPHADALAQTGDNTLLVVGGVGIAAVIVIIAGIALRRRQRS